MAHGVEAYFLERARFERRLTLFMCGVAVAFLGGLWLLSAPNVRRIVLDPRRFGFEGREQFVTRILLENSGATADERDPTTPNPVQMTRGGARPLHLVSSPAAIPEQRPHRLGPGDSEQDLLTRARAIYRHAPVVQSEDLIIERLVKPEYPEDAKNRNIEGHVALVALVDTAGDVVSVDLMGSTGERQLEKAATEAVWQCRFRPYKIDGEVHEVYAVFRFAFRIY